MLYSVLQCCVWCLHLFFSTPRVEDAQGRHEDDLCPVSREKIETIFSASLCSSKHFMQDKVACLSQVNYYISYNIESISIN